MRSLLASCSVSPFAVGHAGHGQVADAPFLLSAEFEFGSIHVSRPKSPCQRSAHHQGLWYAFRAGRGVCFDTNRWPLSVLS